MSGAGGFARTPKPPYYAVIFTSHLSEADAGYAAMGETMFALALAQPCCLGAETARGDDRLGITVSYWADEASILAWKAEAQHVAAQKHGIARWYDHYELRVARVERAYSGPEGRDLG
ncbi:Heme-degrading monooxygenase HmoA [Roseovarius nanhaiticus]|uniref:Heme-degrading monooxygenase HmoA n=1 Tax=Roseovarius nanhaiticus TaxID=573024 RepID=A0A1N7HKM7_9RHOB|nr:antibiotic biosynthesis monooxygenase [Roseovarius nanhaiticus]SEL24872.1 Heme-degrading monooxygenase HmoA [Roseovarius nanhaiticus]SIS25248.1 Heme-degrading monooxygenase HmoA [Roseovarius nanhaiticus]